MIVVYGGKFCYVNADDPLRKMQTIIEEQGQGVAGIEATHCMDMITDEAECEKAAAELAGGEKVWWMPPGWVRFRKLVFKGWDKGLANENFPRHAGGDKPRPYRKLPHIQCRPPEKLLCICNSDIECKGAIIVEPIRR